MQSRRSLLGNDSVNMFRGKGHSHNNRRTVISMQWRGKHASVIKEKLWGNGVSCGSARGYLARIQGQQDHNWRSRLKWQTKMIEKRMQQYQLRVESPAVKRIFIWAIVPRYFECVIQWDCYKSCFKICCQEADIGDRNRLRTLVVVPINCKVRRLAVALW
jgi:hypothetical protein